MKIKIAFVTNMCTHYTRPLFEELARCYDIKFYFTGGYEDYWHKENGLKSGDFKGKYLPGFFLIPKFRITLPLLCLPVRSFDVIVKTIDDRFALPLIFVMAKIFRKPFVLWTGLWAHPQTLIHQVTYGMTKFLYAHADAIITYGEHVRRYLIDLGIDEHKIFCARHTTDNTVYNRPVSEGQQKELKERLGISQGDKIILYVGRLEEGKGLNYLIDAVSGLTPSPVVLFVGTGSKEKFLRRLCTIKGVRSYFVGHVPNEQLYLYYSIADIFVLPSVTTRDFKEPWGLAINEAMNQSCPVVTTNAVGAAAGGLVEDGKTGFIVTEKNSSQLADVIKRLLTNDDLRIKMGTTGHLKIKDWTPQQASLDFSQAINFVHSKNRDTRQ